MSEVIEAEFIGGPMDGEIQVIPFGRQTWRMPYQTGSPIGGMVTVVLDYDFVHKEQWEGPEGVYWKAFYKFRSQLKW